MDSIRGVSNPFNRLADVEEKQAAEGPSFGATLKALYSHVDKQIQEADKKSQEFALGKRQDLVDIMIANEKADIHFKFLMQIRNKLLEAYHEVMRMQF